MDSITIFEKTKLDGILLIGYRGHNLFWRPADYWKDLFYFGRWVDRYLIIRIGRLEYINCYKPWIIEREGLKLEGIKYL